MSRSVPAAQPFPPTPLQRTAEIVIVALITAVTMRLGQISGVLTSGSISAIWPATGVNIAMMFLRGPRIWPGIVLGVVANNLRQFGFDQWQLCLLSAIPNTLEPLLAVGAYRLSRGGPRPFSRTGDTLRAIILWAVVAPAISALIGTPMFRAYLGEGGQTFWSSYLHWAIPNGVGVLVVTPIVLCCRGTPKLPWTNTGLLHAAGIFACLAALEIWVFATAPTSSRFDTHLLIFLVLPLIVWATLVFGARGAAITTFVTSVITIVGAVRGLGPFANVPLQTGLIILHVYLAAFAAVSLLLGAVTEERAEAFRATVKQSQTIQLLFDELNHRVRNNLASLLSLIDLTRGASSDIDRFANLIAGRIRAMADIHSVLASGKWISMTVHELIRSIAPTECIRRIHCEGPEVNVPPQQAMALGLVFHELVVNSLKYGALASGDGQVIVSWTSTPEGSGAKLGFLWHEVPSSRVTPPPHNSHTIGNHNHNADAAQLRSGLELIAGLIRADLRGQIAFSFPPEGARHEFQVHIASAELPV